MEKSERETHDFLNVESFSQLPFIRPAPVKEKGIRLFGKEFGGDYSSMNTSTIGSGFANSAAAAAADEQSDSAHTNPHHLLEESSKDIGHHDNGESTRKFECHYCCRNFPTSQALGGHQNAHKRERQHAKRAHLQSAMMHGGLAAEAAHVYGLMNYHHHRLGSVPTSPALAYHSWSKTSTSYTANSRFYGGGGGHGSYSQTPPINGSPLALWRIPAAHHHPHPHGSSNLISSRDASIHHHPLPLLANDDQLNPPQQVISSNSQTRLGYETRPKMQDHVSLDLHL